MNPEDELETPLIAPETEGPPSGWQSLHRRLLLVVNLVFLTTMAVFLSISFDAEKKLYLRGAFDHVDETLGVLAQALSSEGTPSPSHVQELQSQLETGTGVSHRIFVVAEEDVVVASADPALIGTVFTDGWNVRPIDGVGNNVFLAQDDSGPWLGSSVHLPGNRSSRVVLIRSRAEGERLAGRFVELHGMHVVVTLVLFTALLELVGVRYIRQPIERLTSHIEKVERGDFKVDRFSHRSDELGWLARRFELMATNLRETVRRLVRAEKYSAATAVTLRVARDLEEPLHSLERHILYLEGIGKDDAELNRVAGLVRADRQELLGALRRLGELQDPEDSDGTANGEEGGTA